jgi:hypothetical protein
VLTALAATLTWVLILLAGLLVLPALSGILVLLTRFWILSRPLVLVVALILLGH